MFSTKDTHFILDIETGGLASNSIIYSIGVVKLEHVPVHNMFMIDSVREVFLSAREQERLGRIEEEKTLKFHLNLGTSGDKERSYESDLSVQDIHSILSSFLYSENEPQNKYLWTWHSFDIRLLTNLLEQISPDKEFPFYYRNIHDLATLCISRGHIPIISEGTIQHHLRMSAIGPRNKHTAAYDAVNEACMLQTILNNHYLQSNE